MEKYNNVKMVVLDVDGTLTDGGIYYDSCGNELKRFDVKDGLAIKVGIEAGLIFAVLTGRCSPMVQRRVSELGIQFLEEGIQEKYPALVRFAESNKVLLDEICYIGDDLNDFQAMNSVGLRACPADAAEEIKNICEIVAEHNGGYGAVRECIQILLTKRGEWTECVRRIYSTELN